MPRCPECDRHFLGDDLASRGVFCCRECENEWQRREAENKDALQKEVTKLGDHEPFLTREEE